MCAAALHCSVTVKSIKMNWSLSVTRALYCARVGIDVYTINKTVCYSSPIAVEVVHIAWLGFHGLEQCFPWPLHQQAPPT